MHRLSAWVSWIALIVGVIALILAWGAYNRAGENLEDRIREEVQDIFQQNQQNMQNPTNQDINDGGDPGGAAPATESIRNDTTAP